MNEEASGSAVPVYSSTRSTYTMQYKAYIHIHDVEIDPYKIDRILNRHPTYRTCRGYAAKYPVFNSTSMS